jgi:hypothetical protein
MDEEADRNFLQNVLEISAKLGVVIEDPFDLLRYNLEIGCADNLEQLIKRYIGVKGLYDLCDTNRRYN